jgi:hypothetical protein
MEPPYCLKSSPKLKASLKLAQGIAMRCVFPRFSCSVSKQHHYSDGQQGKLPSRGFAVKPRALAISIRCSAKIRKLRESASPAM